MLPRSHKFHLFHMTRLNLFTMYECFAAIVYIYHDVCSITRARMQVIV